MKNVGWLELSERNNWSRSVFITSFVTSYTARNWPNYMRLTVVNVRANLIKPMSARPHLERQRVDVVIIAAGSETRAEHETRSRCKSGRHLLAGGLALHCRKSFLHTDGADVNDLKSDALVIRMADFSNTSRVVTFFTRESGKVAAIAKGAKRLKGPFDSALDLLAESRIVFLRKPSALDILTEAKLVQRFRPNPSNIETFYAGCYIAELLAGLTEDYDPFPLIYDTAKRTLADLHESDDYQLAVLRFEIVMLREIGLLPVFDACINCGDDIDVKGHYSFWVSQGGILCPKCQKQKYAAHQVQAGTAVMMQRLSESSDELIERIKPSDQQIREMRYTLTAAISATMGRKPKTLKFLKF
jgi:DNA repair protein RecO (recombination protein O)